MDFSDQPLLQKVFSGRIPDFFMEDDIGDQQIKNLGCECKKAIVYQRNEHTCITHERGAASP